MKVFHIESGLGNQMLDYADLLASKNANPMQDHFVETILYEIGDKQNSVSMWNGYELETVFGIREKNVKSLFNASQWNRILEDVLKSEFWDDGWTYSDAIAEAFHEQGLDVLNCHRRPHTHKKVEDVSVSVQKYILKHMYYRVFPSRAARVYAIPDRLYRISGKDEYDGHYLKFMYKGNRIDQIEDELRRVFVFPEYDLRNRKFSKFLKSCNSVAIHARRGDFLGHNAYCYQYGYFKRAVKLVKRKIKNPVFVFFCDPGSVEWCRKNGKIFSLDYRKDYVYFVDWNTAKDSYRDMQLMADCKHNIITNSSFGWWGAFLNSNPGKITISPDAKINTTPWI